MKKLLLFFVLVQAVYASLPESFPTYEIVDLGISEEEIGVTAINNSNQVVGWYRTSGGITKAFLWNNRELVDLFQGTNYQGYAFDINNSGYIVGEVYTPGIYPHGYLRNPNGTFEDLGTLGGRWSEASGINDSGQIVGSSELPEEHWDAAFIWEEGEMEELGSLGGIQGWACSINYSGQAVGSSETVGQRRHATLYDPIQGNIDLHVLAGATGDGSSAYAINNNGEIVGYIEVDETDSNSPPAGVCLWRNESFISMAPLLEGGELSEIYTALAINNVGQIVGPAEGHDGYAFLWNSSVGNTNPIDPNNGFINLNDLLLSAVDCNDWPLNCNAEWTLNYATAINDYGYIAGIGWREDLQEERAFLMIPDSVNVRTLTIAAEPNSVDSLIPNIGHHVYYENTIVNVMAEPFTDCPNVYYLDHWEGDVANPNAATTTVVMDTDKTITAVYAPGDKVCGDLCHPILQGDFNEDCYIDLEDFILYAANWLSCTHPDCD
jgi:probable HAF family extracellular repeat protein